MTLNELLNPPINIIKLGPTVEYTNYLITGTTDVFGYSFEDPIRRYILIANRGENPNQHSIAFSISESPEIVYNHNKDIDKQTEETVKDFIIRNLDSLIKFSNQNYDEFIEDLK